MISLEHNLDPQSPGSENDSEPDIGPPIRSDRPPPSLLREVLFVTTIIAAQLLTRAGIGQRFGPSPHNRPPLPHPEPRPAELVRRGVTEAMITSVLNIML